MCVFATNNMFIYNIHIVYLQHIICVFATYTLSATVPTGTRMACGLRSVGVDCRIFQRENLSTGDVFQPYPKS